MADTYMADSFNALDKRLERVEKITGDVREKVFDGFGESINHIEDKVKTLQTLVISVIIIGGLGILLTLIGMTI